MNDSSGQRLKRYLSRINMEQKELAIILHHTPQYVNAVCSNRTTLGKKLANTLQEKIGVSAAWLLTGTGSMYADDQTAKAVFAAEPDMVNQETPITAKVIHPDNARDMVTALTSINVQLKNELRALEQQKSRLSSLISSIETLLKHPNVSPKE